MNLLDDIRPTWLEVNLDNLKYNMRNIRSFIDEEVKILAVVKADAYGHGAVTCGKVFLENGADMLAVATLTEAIELRKADISAPILVLGYTQDESLDKAIENDITQTIYSLDQANILSDKAREMNKTGNIHIKINTGMSRLGLSVNSESLDIIEEIYKLDNLNVEGIFSHLLESDVKDKSISRDQFKKFKWILNELEDRGIRIPIKHISNSAAALDMPEFNLDMVRIGILLYGMYPSDEVEVSNVDIKLVSSFKTKIAQCREIEKNDFVGYDQGFIADRNMRVATLPVGYSDGYTLEMGQLVRPHINDVPVEVIGNICMDQAMIDISNMENVKRNDPVSLYRYEDDEMIPELICMIGRRVPRVYISNGEIVSIVDYVIGR